MREGEGRLDAFVITPEGKIFPSLGHCMGIRVAGLQHIVKLLCISSTLIANHIHVFKNTPGRADELLYHANARYSK